MNTKKFHLSASLVCGSPLALGTDIKKLERGKMDAIHFDVMDGQFVPRLGLYPELLKSVREITNLPIDVHLMIEDPEQFIKVFINAGATTVVVHAESTPHLHRAIRTIRELGGRPGVALNPSTPLSVLDYVQGDIDRVMLMAINPGIVGHTLIPSMIQKIRDVRNKLTDHPHIEIEIDGGVTPTSAASMVQAGADILVCGTSSVFKKDIDLTKSARSFRTHVTAELAKSI